MQTLCRFKADFWQTFGKLLADFRQNLVDLRDTLHTIFCVLCEKFVNEKKKRGKNFLTFRSGDLNPRFSVIFAHDLNFHGM